MRDARHTFEEAWTAALAQTHEPLEDRDRAFARAIALATLRHHGELRALLTSYLSHPLPTDCGHLPHILEAAAAQLVLLDAPAHAVINVAVAQCQADPKAKRFDKLANAVLRRIAEDGAERLTTLGGAPRNIPPWLWARWSAHYGEEVAQTIAAACLVEPPLDLTLKSAAPGDAEAWAAELGGTVLATSTVRLASAGRVEALPGYADGAWWVQDAAAALPARLLGPVEGLAVADLCAAPGGKTAGLAAAGARVTAVESDPGRVARLAANLQRVRLDADIVTADVTTWQPGRTFDAVLLDAPCTATGTIRRHPDILHLKRAGDLANLSPLQSALLDAAVRLVRPGGVLVYCVCSLEPEEGEAQVAAALARHPSLSRRPIARGEPGFDADWITPGGDLRTLPFHLPGPTPQLSGLDGFYAARLVRHA